MEAARQYSAHEARTHFTEILEAVADGEEVIISKAGEPVAKVVPAAGKVRDFDDMSDDPGFAEAFGLLPEYGTGAAE